MSRFTTKYGVELYYKDWGSGKPVVFCHGWPLCSDSWERQMWFLSNASYRCIAHDRRGHGRSDQPSAGNDMDTYADDLAQLIDHLQLKDITLVGFSTGGGEAARYVSRNGSKAVANLALVSAVTPLMLKTTANPTGTPKDVFDGFRKNFLANRSQFFRDVASGPFFGYNRPGAKPSQGTIDAWWLQGMMAGHKNTYECIAAFSETDFSDDLKKITIPTLIIHGDDDQVVPIDASARAAAKLMPHAKLIEYPGAPHGITDTHADRLNQDLLNFIRA
jgi:non-heme chloroperoxidase